MQMERLNSNFIERIILKGMMSDKDFLVLISSVYEPDFFDDPNIKHIFEFSRRYVDEFNGIPSRDSIINSSENTSELRTAIEEAEGADFDISASYSFLLDQTNDYLKEKALKLAIVESVDDVEDPERRNAIRDRIENALVKDIKVDLGLRYFEEMKERLKRIFTATDSRIPTFFPVFDELINGGFPPFTFNVLTAKIHGGKSNTMANMAARQVLHGYNAVVISLEMSQDAFAQRFDGIYSGLDINRIYLSNFYKRKLMSKLLAPANILERDEKRGELYIKQYPTGGASVLDFRIYLRELVIRDIQPHIVYVDYINLMKTAYQTDKNMYSVIKRVSEELRALSFEFKCPIVSVSQLNREGFFVAFNELDFNYVAESMGIPATADFMAILGLDEDQMVYQNEILYKITKSRIGGRVGHTDKFYLDARSLKMYDSSEMDLWIEEAQESGDERDTIDHAEREQRNRRGRNDRNRER